MNSYGCGGVALYEIRYIIIIKAICLIHSPKQKTYI